MSRHPAEGHHRIAFHSIDTQLDQVKNLESVVNATAGNHANLGVMLADVGYIPHHVFVERPARHAAAVTIGTERSQVFELGFNREFANLLGRVSIAHHHAVHARTNNHVHHVYQVTFRQVRANLGIHGLTDGLRITVLHDFTKNTFGQRQVHVHTGFAGIGAAQIDFDKVAGLVGDSETFEQVLQLFFVIGEARSFSHGHTYAKTDLVGLGQLFVGTTSDDFDAFVVETHAIMDSTVIFQKTDTRAVRIALTEPAGRSPNRNTTKAHIRIIANALGSLVGSGRQNDGATEVQGIAVVRE